MENLATVGHTTLTKEYNISLRYGTVNDKEGDVLTLK